jgi:Fic family protein
MGNLEKFLHDQHQRTPALIKAALAHVQFESIHPFLDGNGRLGRLLITLILCAEGVLQQPLLYLSLFFKQHRQEYYDLLQRVRLEGDWVGWLRFFLEGMRETARQAGDTAARVLRMFAQDDGKVEGLGRRAGSARRVHDLLRRHPITTIPIAAKLLNLTAPTVRSAVESLERLGVAREVTGKRRDRIYVYDQYVRILDEGTEPL